MKFGKVMCLKWIPFSELINPFELLEFKEYSKETVDSINCVNSRPLKTIKTTELKALENSIQTYGLLNPLSVMKCDKGYVLIDGQRRYFALQKIIMRDFVEYCHAKGITMVNEYTGSYTGDYGEYVSFKKKTLGKMLIPCIVYGYTTLDEGMRHSVEDNKFGVRPSTIYLDYAERKPTRKPNIFVNVKYRPKTDSEK